MAVTPAKIKRVQSENYKAVMEDAERRAKNRANKTGEFPLVTLEDLFKSLCAVSKESFAKVLGAKVSLPRINPAVECSNQPVLAISDEVSERLFPYDGVLGKLLERHSPNVVLLEPWHIAAALLYEPIKPMEKMLSSAGLNRKEIRARVEEFLKNEDKEKMLSERTEKLQKRFEDINKIREYLAARCFGQDEAINTLIKQLSIHWTMDASKDGKPLSFFFAGAPGTGKNLLATLLQEAFEKILGIPQLPDIDMARYCSDQVVFEMVGQELSCGSDSLAGSSESSEKKISEGIIVIDNYECADPSGYAYVNRTLETGIYINERTGSVLNFSNNVFIIITHERDFSESEDFINLVSSGDEGIPRDKIIEGLVRYQPKFYSTLRLIDTPILFSKHNFKSFFAITKDRLSALEKRYADNYGVKCSFQSEDVFRALIDMHPNIDSAHPIVSGLDNAILMPIQDWLLKNYKKFSACRNIRIECDAIPDFEGVAKRKDFKSFEEWMKKITEQRILRAKRLVFKSKVEQKAGDLVLRFTDMSYKVLPSIEDSEYFSVTVPDVSFKDLVGVDTVREHVKEIIEYVNNPQKGKVKPETGIILYGPPGTGKTSVAKAIANEMGVPFIMVTGADFSKKYYGEGVEEVKKLFAAARRYGALVFIDEIDAIGSRNTSTDSGKETARVINAFLTELDGFKSRNSLVIGATNRYDDLDDALVRPGRLSLKIQLGLLHKPEDRRKLIERTLKNINVKLDSKILDTLVNTTNAWSPADLVAMINGGVRKAQKAQEPIKLKHFVEARTVVSEGEDPQSHDGSQETAHLIAVHEAGHAVVAALRGMPIVQVTINGVGDAAGFLERVAGERIQTKEGLEKLIDVSLGGRGAEEIFDVASTGVQSDFENATTNAIRMVKLGLEYDNLTTIFGEDDIHFAMTHRNEISGILDARMAHVRTLLHKHKIFLDAVIEALKRQRILLEADIISIKKDIEKE